MRPISARLERRWQELPERTRALLADAVVVLVGGLLTVGVTYGQNVWWGLLATAALIPRRPLPLLALLSTASVDTLAHIDVFPAIAFSAYAVGRWSKPVHVVIGVPAILALFLFGPGEGVDRLGGFGGLAEIGFFVLCPVLLGLYVRRSVQLMTAHRDRAEALQQQRLLLAERAVLEERARIAEELHDAVGHRLSLIVLHAGAMELTAPRHEVRAALIRAEGKAALHDLRHAIGLLRDSRNGTPPSTPVGVQAVRDLLTASQQAGVPVEATVDAGLDQLDPDLARTVHGVLREALTNVHKHAGQAQTHVEVRCTSDDVRVEVLNERPDFSPATQGLGSGSGLVALAKRVGAVGGRLEHGPTPGGGFRVEASFPHAS